MGRAGVAGGAPVLFVPGPERAAWAVSRRSCRSAGTLSQREHCSRAFSPTDRPSQHGAVRRGNARPHLRDDREHRSERGAADRLAGPNRPRPLNAGPVPDRQWGSDRGLQCRVPGAQDRGAGGGDPFDAAGALARPTGARGRVESAGRPHRPGPDVAGSVWRRPIRGGGRRPCGGGPFRWSQRLAAAHPATGGVARPHAVCAVASRRPARSPASLRRPLDAVEAGSQQRVWRPLGPRRRPVRTVRHAGRSV